MAQSEIIVIGAGVLGTFHAYFAARQGHKVTLIERNAFPNDASVRNFGMLTLSIVEGGGEWAGYAFNTAATYRELQQKFDISVRQTGSLYLASNQLEATVLQEFARTALSGYAATYLEPQEALARYSFIQKAYCHGALLLGNDLTLEPRQMLPRLIPYLVEKMGVTYVPNTTIVDISVTGKGCQVSDSKGQRWLAPHVFLCSGTEFSTLFPEHFQKSGLTVCKLQMLQTVVQPEILPHSVLSGLSILRYPVFKSCPSYPLLAKQPTDPYLVEKGVHLLFKQARDGSVIIGDSHEYFPFSEASTIDFTIDCPLNQAILDYAREMITLSDWEIQRIWTGFYMSNPLDEIYTATIDGAIHIVTGIGGKGMTTGPGFVQAHLQKLGF